MRIPFRFVLLGAVVAMVVVALVLHKKSDDPLSLGTQQRQLAGSPPALAGLHVQASRLLDGGTDGFARRLAALKGHPVVVNKWASWCGPCRMEFPSFQRASASTGKRVAFVGVNANDNDAAAGRFLHEFPVTFPSYKDGKGRIARKVSHSTNFPVTAFYDASGRQQYVHQGPYATAADLERDIRRYT